MTNVEQTIAGRASAALLGLGERARAFIERRERLCRWTALAIFAAFAVYRALITPLWFDELFTLFIARLTSLPEFLRAMPVDNQPPLGDALTHLCLRLFGQNEIAVRLPEIFSYLLAGFVTYKIVRRRGTAVQALFAMALLLGASVNKIQAITARPYELMLLMTALVYLCWQRAAERDRQRLLPLCALALGVAGAVLTHHFAIIQVGVLLFAGEATRLWQRRRLDWAMLFAILAGLLPLVWTIQIMRQSRMLLGEPILHSAVFWARPGIASLKSYQTMAALPLLCIVAVIAALLWSLAANSGASGHDFSRAESGGIFDRALAPAELLRETGPASAAIKIPSHDWAAAIALALLVPIQIVVTSVATNYYLPRYAIGASLGLALLFAWMIPHLARLRNVGQPMLALSTACFVVSVAVTLLIAQVRHPVWRPQLALRAESPLLQSAPADLPIVVANGLDYAPEWWYAPDALKPRLVYLYDVSYAEQKRDPLPELSLSEGAFYIPMSVESYAPFLAAHSRFLLLAAGDARLLWLPQRLADEGWRLEPIAAHGSDRLYRVSRP